MLWHDVQEAMKPRSWEQHLADILRTVCGSEMRCVMVLNLSLGKKVSAALELKTAPINSIC